jgi:hypothetical protein
MKHRMNASRLRCKASHGSRYLETTSRRLGICATIVHLHALAWPGPANLCFLSAVCSVVEGSSQTARHVHEQLSK